MHQTRMNIRSTQPPDQPPNHEPTVLNDVNPLFDGPSPPRTKLLYAYTLALCDTQLTGKIATDQTGRFICPSTRGNQYILILHDWDSNIILGEPMQRKTKHQHVEAYQRAILPLQRAGLHPSLAKLDNEASKHLIDFLADIDIRAQLAPPGMHRANPAERAIQTYKNHLIAGLCSTPPDFPLNKWDQLIPQ
jgi:hypothetical protein